MHASEFLLRLKNLQENQLLNIKGLGPILVENVLRFLDSPRFSQLVENFQELEKKGLGPEILLTQASFKEAENGEEREIICITGTFERPRGEIAQELETVGAKVVDTISKQTTILLCGQKAGSKLEKAQKMGLKIFENLEELKQFLESETEKQLQKSI